VLSYREAKDGQVLEEGITEAGPRLRSRPAGTAVCHARRTHRFPFYIFYSMFGFQRTGRRVLGVRRCTRAGLRALVRRPDGPTLNGEGLAA
jgi:pyruvate dehydrogenase E1 component